MVSAGVGQALKIAAALLALAAQATAPKCAAAAEAGARPERQLIETIQQITADDGENAIALLEPLTSLIGLYQEGGDDALAAVAIERSQQIVRVNNGLHTLDQLPYVRQLIRIEEQRGNHAAAWELEQDLLALVRRYPDDLRTVGVFREVAERQMDLMGRYLAGQKPPQLYLGCYYGGNCNSGSREGVVRRMLADAQRNYWDAITVMLRNEQYASDELRDLELHLLRGTDLVRTLYDQSQAHAGYGAYHRGRQSLRRLYGYGAVRNAPAVQQVGALVQMADWELLYSRHGDAVDVYERAVAILRNTDGAATGMEDLFVPELPVVLPAFQPNPLARDESKDATGHVDVAFDITKYGRGRAVEILGAANVTRDAQHRLVSLIMNSRFRPRPSDGAFDRASRVAVRYYVYD
jgi:hypothetical protein